jgi:hypothetical protein
MPLDLQRDALQDELAWEQSFHYPPPTPPTLYPPRD